MQFRRRKEQFLAAEKVKRQKWEAEKAAQLKHTTIKGLEADLQHIMLSNAEQLQKQQLQHEADLAAQEKKKKEELQKQRKQLEAEFERKLSEA